MLNGISIGIAAVMLGVSAVTLRRWDKSGSFRPRFRTVGGHRRYDLHDIARLRGEGDGKVETTDLTVCYARVSCHDQKDDLQRQADKLSAYCQAKGWSRVEVITDLGSGLNYGKRGLRRLIGLICTRRISRLVVTHKDRLLRFGSELVFELCRAFGIEVVMTEATLNEDVNSRLVTDVIELMTVFSARLYGARSHRKKNLDLAAISA